MPARLTSHDSQLASSFIVQLSNGKIEFQFPPKVSSDGRSGTWKEKEMRGTEPVAIFSTSGPREITLTATYIVDGSSGWSASKIHDQIVKARGYFALVRSGNATRQLIVKLKMWGIGGKKMASARLTNIGVKYSDTIVGSGNDAFPLRTDLTLDVRLWTKGAGEGEVVQNVEGLDEKEMEEWY